MTLARRMFLASVVLALVVGLAFAALMVAVSAQRDATKRETRSQDVTAEALRLEALIFDMETGVRGFVLSENDVYLEAYTKAKRELPARISALQALVRDDPAQRKRAESLVNETRQYREFTETVTALVKADPGVGVDEFDLYVADEGKQYTDGIRTRMDNFLRDEERLAMTASADADRQADIALLVGALGLAASTALILLFGYYLARSVGRPVRSVARAASRLAGGEWSLRLPQQGPGEIGELTRSFNEMADQIE